MATGLVKWWRARFLAGYKPFSVVGGIAEGSDSEELLATAVATPCNSSPLPTTTSSQLIPEALTLTGHSPVSSPLPSPTPTPTPIPTLAQPQASVPVPTSTPPPPPSSSSATATATAAASPPVTNHADEQTPIPTTRQLSFEEFECDVSVAEGNRRRQEFSFTLYDFDGHGKITKDDIAGLVTTIYDTLGASIQVPPCGSKTIKVKLTVSPDKSIGQAGSPVVTAKTATNNVLPTITTTATNNGANTSSCCHVKPVNSCSHATHASRRGGVPRRRRALRTRAEPERVNESHSEEDADNVPINPTKQEELRKRVGPVPHFPSAYSNSSEGDISDDSDLSPTITPLTPLVANHRKRSGSMQRQQLLEIIQANMEKNNLSFHASRKRHQSEHLRIPLQRPCTNESTSSPPYVQRSRPPSVSRQPPAYHKPVREYSHHATSLPKLPAKGRGNLRKIQNHNHHHHNTNVQQCNVDVITSTVNKQVRNNLQSTSPIVTQNILNSEAIHNNHGNIINNHVNNQRNDVQYIQSQQAQSKASKKHQLKHATREQDQARAMAQVVRWLEREFTQTAAATTAGRRHVHEHIHHHYHHYNTEALV